ncbi:carboxypeptidase-like regulatory domain-containing protein [Dysgonomonas sp. Marseille-P4677]|nr:carboxypeptidase-like regulatory domain-containing protein [Dysgonomonas sp. Marseille-P4677]
MIKYYLVSLVALLLSVSSSSAQNFKGQLLDPSDKPLAGATVYIKEAKQGVVSDADGQFQTILDGGVYTVEYKHPEYKTIKKTISIDSSAVLTDTLILEKKTLFFDETEVKNDTIASHIIKSVMDKASFYMQIIPDYKAASYIKGDMKISEVSSITDLATYKVEKVHLSKYKDKPFYQEIYNKIDYFRPDKYKLTIRGYSGNIPDDFNFKGIINSLGGNIYSHRFNGFISPVNPDGFSYYRYKYEGFYIEHEKILHKIKVESKVKDPELLNGYLYIMDEGRYIVYSQLMSNTQGMMRSTLIAYGEMEPAVYLPLTYYTNIDFNLLGTRGDIAYYTSLKYKTISENKTSSNVSSIYKGNEQIATQVIVEPTAYRRDVAYWDRVRTNPLRLLTSEGDTISEPIRFEKKKYHPGNFWFGKIVLGGYIHGSDTSKWSLKYSGVKEVFKDYNYVDGFWIGEKFEIKSKLSGNRTLNITPHIYYVTARHRAIGWSDAVFNYAPDR